MRGSVDALIAFPLLVLRVGAFVKDDLRIALEREDVGGDTVQEPTVVRDYHGTAGKVLQTLLQCTQRIYVDVVRRLVEQYHVALLFESHCQMQTVALATR